MMLEKTKTPEPLPRWLLLPLGFGLLLTMLGLAMPWLYPQKTLWTEEDAQKHSALATDAHAAHHAAAHAVTNKKPTVKENVAEARWRLEQYNHSAERLRQVREGGNRYGNWLLIAGIALTSIGVVAALMLRRE